MRSAALASLILGCVASAAAEPLRVEYLVDRTFLRSNLGAESTLTFELFSDAACASAIATIPVPVSDPNLVLEKIDRLSVRGVKPRPARLAAIRAVTGAAGCRS